MLAALGEYASGSDIDVFNIARDLEYGIEEASSDHNILHTLLLFKHYELPWLQNDASGYAKPSWFFEAEDSPKLPVLAEDTLVYRDSAYKGVKYEIDWGRVGRPLSTTWRPRKGRLIPIKLPRGAPSIYFGGIDSCEGRKSEFEVILPRFCSFQPDENGIRVVGYGGGRVQCQILMTWLPLMEFLREDLLVPDDVQDLWDDIQEGDKAAVDKIGKLLEMRPCREGFYAKRVAESEEYLVVNLFGKGDWEFVGGDMVMARVENTVFVIKKADLPHTKRVKLSSAATSFVNHLRL